MADEIAVPKEVLEAARAQAQAEAKNDWESTSLCDSIRLTDVLLRQGVTEPTVYTRWVGRFHRASDAGVQSAKRILLAEGGTTEANLDAAITFLRMSTP